MSSSISRLCRIFSNTPSYKPLKNPTPQTPKNLTKTLSNANKPKPKPSTQNALVENLYKETNLAKVVETFKTLSETPHFRKKLSTYKHVIHRLKSANKLSEIEEVLEHQKKFADITKEGFAIRLILLYGKAGMFENSLKLFDELPELKCTRGVRSFNALLTACILSKNFDNTEKLFREVSLSSSITPDCYSYNIVIQAFCEMGFLDSAVLMLDEMEKNGVKLNAVTFNTLLNGFYSKGHFSDGERIWAKMEESGIVPNIVSFNAKLEGLVSGGKISDAVELVEQLGSSEVKPINTTYNILIKWYCNDGNLDEAKRLYYQLLKHDLVPKCDTFEVLITCVCEKGDFDLALKLCQESVKSIGYLSAGLMQVVVDGLVKESKVEEAEKLRNLSSVSSLKPLKYPTPPTHNDLTEKLCKENHKKAPSTPLTNPTPQTQKSLMKYLLNEKNFTKLVENFKTFSELPWFRSERKFYNVIVRRLAIAKEFSKIEEVLEHQKKFKDISKEGFAMRLISLYGKVGMFDHSLKLFDELPELNCKHSVMSFSALLTASVQSKKYDKTEKLFRELPRTLSITPNHYAYNIVIQAFCELGSLESVLSMLDEMEKNGVKPKLSLYNNILDVFYSRGQFTNGDWIWDNMEESGIVPDILSYNSKLQGLVNVGNISEAIEFYQQLRSKVKATRATYNSLIKLYCNVGNLDEAKMVYDALLENDFVPNNNTFESLIPCVCEKGDLDLALKLCEDSLSFFSYPDARVVQVVVDGLVKESKVEEAKELIKLASKRKYYRVNLKMPQR